MPMNGIEETERSTEASASGRSRVIIGLIVAVVAAFGIAYALQLWRHSPEKATAGATQSSSDVSPAPASTP
jgi:flagellar basal body-associated protein FliL